MTSLVLVPADATGIAVPVRDPGLPAFTSLDAGRSSAAGVLFFVAFGVLAVGCLRLMDKLSFYDN